MNEKQDVNEVYIVKLGGSVITDKNQPFSIRKIIISNLLTQIKNSEKKIIIVHGGGSFGHPLAKEYQIHKGFNPEIDDQILGFGV